VHVAKRVAAQLADTDPVLHLFSLSRQKRWGSVDFATSAGSNREPGRRRRHARIGAMASLARDILDLLWRLSIDVADAACHQTGRHAPTAGSGRGPAERQADSAGG
jgi:hypothetical protein